MLIYVKTRITLMIYHNNYQQWQGNRWKTDNTNFQFSFLEQTWGFFMWSLELPDAHRHCVDDTCSIWCKKPVWSAEGLCVVSMEKQGFGRRQAILSPSTKLRHAASTRRAPSSHLCLAETIGIGIQSLIKEAEGQEWTTAPKWQTKGSDNHLEITGGWQKLLEWASLHSLKIVEPRNLS